SSSPWKYNLSIKNVVINNGVKSIGNYAFYSRSGLTSITIPNSVTSIGSHAFSCCEGLASVTIGNSVTSIGSSPFWNSTGLTSINVAEDNLNYASIDGVLYSKDKKTLRVYPQGKTGSFTIPNGVTSIGSTAFGICTGLTSVTIPNSVTSIGRQAFYNFTGLTSMTVEATNPPFYSTTSGIVSNYNIPLYVPAGSVDAYKAADKWKKFKNIQAIPATGVKETTAEKREVKKIIDRNGIIYIEKDGTRYFLNGDKVE
ncbi:MAG: leucine-rich repeat domain-containing protein, partial [Paludibacteraceae bacterium]|nr:leucine-rich repeat domain-containing protein [Paludibacteraceae bacterium]